MYRASIDPANVNSSLCESRRRFATILLLIIRLPLLIGALASLELVREAIAASRGLEVEEASDCELSKSLRAPLSRGSLGISPPRKSRCNGFNRNVASKFLHCAYYALIITKFAEASRGEASLQAMRRKLAVINRVSHVK